MRKSFIADLPTVEQAIDHVVNSREGPMVLADQGDNVFGGPRDGTVLFKGLLEAEQDSTGVLYDHEAVEQCIKAGVGKAIEFRIGAKTDNLHGTPIIPKGRVKSISGRPSAHKPLD